MFEDRLGWGLIGRFTMPLHWPMQIRAGLPPAVWGGLHCKCPTCFAFMATETPRLHAFMALTNLVTYIDGPHFNRHPPLIPQMLKVKRKVKGRATVKEEFPVSFFASLAKLQRHSTGLSAWPKRPPNPHLCYGALMETTLSLGHWLCKIDFFSKREKKYSAKYHRWEKVQFANKRKTIL